MAYHFQMLSFLLCTAGACVRSSASSRVLILDLGAEAEWRLGAQGPLPTAPFEYVLKSSLHGLASALHGSWAVPDMALAQAPHAVGLSVGVTTSRDGKMGLCFFFVCT